MDDAKPIRMLMLLSLISYAAYLLLYLVIVLGQPHTTRLFGTAPDIDPYYNWFDLVLLFFSAAARALLYWMVIQHLRAGAGRSFLVIGIFSIVLLVLLPVFVNPVYHIVTSMVVARHDGANRLTSYSILWAALNWIAPLASIANYSALAGCSIAWYRNFCRYGGNTDPP